MDKCNDCLQWEQKFSQLENRLRERLGLRLSIPMLRDLGFIIEMTKPVRTCDECGARHYAKGRCYTHYMQWIRQSRAEEVNELGQHLGRKGKVLCEVNGCEYLMTQPMQFTDGKWYCNHHWQERFDQAKEAEKTNLDPKKGNSDKV